MAVQFRNLPDAIIPEEDMNKPIPLGPNDGSLRHGRLSNGMTYYVKTCQKPKSRAALALVVKVGSINEEEEERGVAHIVEHLAFNATENYKNHDIVRFLESIGSQFGACQNAYTSCDETVYELMVPTDDPSLLDQALSVFAEFAVKVRCAPEDLEKERGAVMEEWRMGNNQSGRTAQAYWKTVLEGCKYAERLPIGLESVIKSVPASVVKGFYERWYHPGNMAIVVVGDFQDPDNMVSRVQQAMASCAPRSGASAPPHVSRVEIALHDKPRCVAYKDPEVVQAQVHLSFKKPRNSNSSPADYREFIKDQLFQQMLNNRLFKISRGEKPPFYSAQASSDQLCVAGETFNLTASVAEGATTKAVEALLLEIARVRVHGFSCRELKIAQQQLMSEAETTFLERDQSYSQDVRDEYVRHFLNGEFVVGAEEEARLTKTFLPKVALDDLQPLAAVLSANRSCVIKTVEHQCKASAEDLLATVSWVQALEASGKIDSWHQNVAPEHVMDVSKLVPGTVVGRREYPKLGAVELQLSNGIRCCCKCTQLLKDQVLITGFAAGGLSEVPKEEFRSASLAPIVAGELGIFGFQPAVMSDILAGKRVELKPKEGAYWRSFSGDQSPEDLETALQLIHKLFVSRVEPVASELAVVMQMTRETIAAQIRDPLHAFSNRVRRINYGNCYYFEPFTMAEFRKVNPKVSCDHFNTRYCNPKDFTLCLTGNINIEEITPLLEKYIGSIPVLKDNRTTAKLSPKDVKSLPYAFPAQPLEEHVYVPMVMPITQTQITFPVTIPRDKACEEAVWISLCCRLLETRLIQLMRFQFGEVYTVSITPFFGLAAPSTNGIVSGDIALGFNCDPSKSQGLTKAAMKEICMLQDVGPSHEEVNTLLILEQRQYELQQEENSYWHDQIVGGYQSRHFQDTGDLDDTYYHRHIARLKVLEAADSASLKEALQRILPHPANKRFTTVTMVPSTSCFWMRNFISQIKQASVSIGNMCSDAKSQERLSMLTNSMGSLLLVGSAFTGLVAIAYLSSRRVN